MLRHASAGERLSSPSRDRARRLDRLGRAQAAKLAETFSTQAIERILSSPHRRCVDSVTPLAKALGLAVEIRAELAPDAARRDALALMRELPRASIACTHREVIELLFDPGITCEKGGAWLLGKRGRRFVPTAYLPPPLIVPGRRTRAALV